MKSVPIPRNTETLHLFDTWRYRILVILFFSSVVNWCLAYGCTIQLYVEHVLKLTRLAAIISP